MSDKKTRIDGAITKDTLIKLGDTILPLSVCWDGFWVTRHDDKTSLCTPDGKEYDLGRYTYGVMDGIVDALGQAGRIMIDNAYPGAARKEVDLGLLEIAKQKKTIASLKGQVTKLKKGGRR